MKAKAEQAAKVLDFFTQNGVELFNFSVLEAKEGGKTAMLSDKYPRDRAGVEKALVWGPARNIRGANVYFRPARHDADGVLLAHPVVFLDDLPPAKAAGIAKKYRSIVVETSASNYQVWIVTNRPLAEDERYRVQGSLLRRIGGDPGSVSGEHFGRFPGYANNKPGRSGFRVAVRHCNAIGQTLDVAPHLAEAHQATETPTLPPTGGRVPSSPTQGATDNESVREFRFAIARLRAGDKPENIVKRIAEHALARGKRGGNAQKCEAYASNTVRTALGFVSSSPAASF